MKIWGENLVMSDRLWAAFNVRRASVLLIQHRYPVPGLKLSRRSRRRWRGVGCEWAYPEVYLKALEDACDAYERMASA